MITEDVLEDVELSVVGMSRRSSPVCVCVSVGLGSWGSRAAMVVPGILMFVLLDLVLLHIPDGVLLSSLRNSPAELRPTQGPCGMEEPIQLM